MPRLYDSKYFERDIKSLLLTHRECSKTRDMYFVLGRRLSCYVVGSQGFDDNKQYCVCHNIASKFKGTRLPRRKNGQQSTRFVPQTSLTRDDLLYTRQ